MIFSKQKEGGAWSTGTNSANITFLLSNFQHTRKIGRLRPASLHHILAKPDQQDIPMIYNATGRTEGQGARIGQPEVWWQAAA
jgi:hypothetical protein